MKTQTIKQRLLHSTMIGGTALMALVAAPAVTLMTPSVAVAQDFVQGAVSGTVTNQAGAPVSGASVSLRSVNQGFTRSFTTDANGSFRAVALPPGSYEVVVNASGFNSLTDTLSVNAGGTTSVDLTVGAADDNATQIDEVIVVGVRQAVSEFDATTTGLVVNVEELSRNVPIGRDATSLALLAPGVTQSDSAFGNLPSISGASAGENTYYVNGLNITDFVSFLGGSTVPFEFYQTFETKTGGYSAEFGRATGGVLNATTKSGGNEWEFGITGYWEPEDLRETTPNTYLALNEFDERKSWDVILEAGGPVIQDRLFVYGLYNAREREAFDRGTNGLGFRAMTDDPFYGAKVDFLLNDDHRLEMTYWSDETTQETDQTTFFASDAGSREDGTIISEFGGTNWIARYTGVWTDWLTTSIAYGENENNTRQYSDEDVNAVVVDITGFDYNGDGIEDVAPGLTAQRGNWLVGSPSSNNDLRKMFRADVDVYASLFGEHHLRAGLDYEKLESSQSLQRSGEGYNYCRPSGPINAAAGINCSGDRTGGIEYRYQTAL
ncbi:MAG: TonB-dependent receptor, partial [Brevundimonas sp.]|nr:TonB-dependent receptor [Brevundimonas sp.]